MYPTLRACLTRHGAMTHFRFVRVPVLLEREHCLGAVLKAELCRGAVGGTKHPAPRPSPARVALAPLRLAEVRCAFAVRGHAACSSATTSLIERACSSSTSGTGPNAASGTCDTTRSHNTPAAHAPTRRRASCVPLTADMFFFRAHISTPGSAHAHRRASRFPSTRAARVRTLRR